ncbi:unnamed protein product, partial [Protopolystoma xenopodis]
MVGWTDVVVGCICPSDCSTETLLRILARCLLFFLLTGANRARGPNPPDSARLRRPMPTPSRFRPRLSDQSASCAQPPSDSERSHSAQVTPPRRHESFLPNPASLSGSAPLFSSRPSFRTTAPARRNTHA